MASTRLLPLVLPLSLLVPLACGEPDGENDELADASETGDGDGDGDGNSSNPGDGDGDNPGDGDGDGDNPGDGDGDNPGDGDGDNPGDGDGDNPGDGDGDNPSEGLYVQLLPNSSVLRETNNDGVLTASCMLFEDGLPAAQQPEFSYAVGPEQGVTDNGDSWSFDEFGTWMLSCETTVDNQVLSQELEVAVLNDAIDARVAAVGAGLGTSQAALARVLAADGGDDQALIDAIAELSSVGPSLADAELALADLDDVLIELPHGYPSPAALDGAGILATADDDAFEPALDAVNLALDNLVATYASFDPQVEPTQADLDALEAAGVELDAALEAAGALELSAHSSIASRNSLAVHIRDHLSPALTAIDGYVIARAEVEAEGLFGFVSANPIDNKEFGLLGFTLGMFNQSYIRVRLVNAWYGDVLADLDKSINNLILNDLLNYFLPPNPNGPLIEFLSASASVGFALPGYDTWAYGSFFNSDPAFNMFIILGSQWQGAVDQIIGGCGISGDNTIPENVDAADKCIDAIQDAVDSAINYGDEVIEPGLLGGQDVHIGPFPAVCEGFLPVATLVIPVNRAVGRGETWLTNCLP